MKRPLFLLVVVILLFGALVIKAKAWGPCTHIYYTRKALDQAKGFQIADLVESHWEWFLTGLVYPDVTVIYYYTQWVSYSATHAWQFQTKLWNDAVSKGSEKAMAFAVGVGVHLIQDCIAHNYYIPFKIRLTMVQNNIIHPLTEGFVETELIADPDIGYLVETESTRAFLMYNKPIDDSEAFRKRDGTYMTPIEWTNQILGQGWDFSQEAATFNTILSQGAFYTKGFAMPRESGGWWQFYGMISDIISKFVKVEDAEPYIQQSIDATVRYFKASLDYGGKPVQFIGEFDPTGYDALKAADAFVVNTTVIVVVIFVIIVTLYYRKKMR